MRAVECSGGWIEEESSRPGQIADAGQEFADAGPEAFQSAVEEPIAQLEKVSKIKKKKGGCLVVMMNKTYQLKE